MEEGSLRKEDNYILESRAAASSTMRNNQVGFVCLYKGILSETRLLPKELTLFCKKRSLQTFDSVKAPVI